MKKIVLLFVLCLAFFSSNTFAATKEDVISAINKTYTIGDETYKLPDNVITKAENYLNNKKLPNEKYDKMIALINEMIEIAQRAGTTDVSEMSSDDIRAGLDVLSDASNSLEIDISKELAENNITIESLANSSKVTTNTNPTPTKTNSEKKDNTEISYNSGEVSVDKTSSGNEEPLPDTNVVVPRDSGNSSSMSTIGKLLKIYSDYPIVKEIVKYIPLQLVVKMVKFFAENDRLFVICAAIIIFINFLIICLIFRSKWNRILKYIGVIFFALLFIASVAVLIFLLAYREEIITLYKSYYNFV